MFNRDFTNGYLEGKISKNMFIDNPLEHSAIYLSETNDGFSGATLEKAKEDVYDERTGIIKDVEERIAPLRIEKLLCCYVFRVKVAVP